jgi:serine/threonine protein kinase
LKGSQRDQKFQSWAWGVGVNLACPPSSLPGSIARFIALVIYCLHLQALLVLCPSLTCIHALARVHTHTYTHTHTHTLIALQVAVKDVHVSSSSELTTFLREVEALSSLRHPHVLPFLGACMLGGGQFWLLTEFMEQVG